MLRHTADLPVLEEADTDSGSDFILNGTSCWIEAGDFVIYILKDDRGNVSVEAFINGDEMADPLESFTLEAD
jgi:hypothetical protein